MFSTIAITGANGRIGQAVRPLLTQPGRTLRLIDVHRSERAEQDGKETVVVDIDDQPGMNAALAGADALIHLAGIPSEHPWDEILATNIHGTYVALEAARQAGITTVFVASSIHAVGTATLGDVARTTEPNPRPDTLYGVSKAAMEGLGNVFAERFGMTVVSARICYFAEQPGSGLEQLTWVSPADIARVMEATLALSEPGHHVVWAVSAQAQPWLRPDAGNTIGFRAEDNACTTNTAPSAALQATRLTLDVPIGGDFLFQPVGRTS